MTAGGQRATPFAGLGRDTAAPQQGAPAFHGGKLRSGRASVLGGVRMADKPYIGERGPARVPLGDR